LDFEDIISDFKKARILKGRPKKKKPLCHIIKTRIDKVDKIRLERLLNQKNMSESELLRKAIKDYLAKNEKPIYRINNNEPY